MSIAIVAAAIVVVTLVLFGAWLLALVHMVQRMEDPIDRTKWLLLFILLNVFAPLVYAMTAYRKLRRQNKGSIITCRGRRPTYSQNL